MTGSLAIIVVLEHVHEPAGVGQSRLRAAEPVGGRHPQHAVADRVGLDLPGVEKPFPEHAPPPRGGVFIASAVTLYESMAHGGFGW